MIGFPGEYGFDSEEELVDYVLGQGDYESRRSFEPGDADRSEQEDILHKLSPKCPSCLDDIHQWLQNGAIRGEIDKDPTLSVQEWENERESYRTDIDEVTERYVVAYCEEHDDEMFLSFEETIR